jgi:hypothetical protein
MEEGLNDDINDDLIPPKPEEFIYVLDEDSANAVIDQICHLIAVYRRILDSRKLSRQIPPPGLS